MNAEFQRTARRDKKAFLSDQWKKIEGNNRLGSLFKRLSEKLSSRKLEIQGNTACNNGLNKGQKYHGPKKSRRY